MIDNIATGDKINVKIVHQPSSVAARKTLVRLLSKDPRILQENRRLAKARELHTKYAQRGGRQWAIRVVKQHPVKGTVGESGTFFATIDVLRDLGSVERFVEVAKA